MQKGQKDSGGQMGSVHPDHHVKAFGDFNSDDD